VIDEDELPAEDLAEPGCPGCQRLLKRVKKLEFIIENFQALVVKLAALEARVNQNSSNSSIPPSADSPSMPPRPKKEPTGRKPGGQPGHDAHNRDRQPRECVSRTIEYHPKKCDRCGKTFSGRPGSHDPEPLRPGYGEVLTAIREAPATNVDETGWYERNRLCRLWTAATRTAASFQIQAKRGRKDLRSSSEVR
jgi:hypothetical protein